MEHMEDMQGNKILLGVDVCVCVQTTTQTERKKEEGGRERGRKSDIEKCGKILVFEESGCRIRRDSLNTFQFFCTSEII